MLTSTSAVMDLPDPAPDARRDVKPLLLTVEDVAALLYCSTKHVIRLFQAGEFPKPVMLGKRRRWRRADIEQWVADGCPVVPKQEFPPANEPGAD
jgi:excisionase family DNA binding protein